MTERDRHLTVTTANGQRVHLADAYRGQTLLVVEGGDDTRAACLLDGDAADQVRAFLDPAR